MNDNTVAYDAKIMLTDTLGMARDTELAHRRLCDLIFATGEPPLDLDEVLSELTRAPVGSWGRIKGELKLKGWKLEAGRFTHDGAAILARKSLDTATRLSEAGRAGATARWGKEPPPDGDANATASPPDATAYPTAMRSGMETASEPQCDRNASLKEGVQVQVKGTSQGSDKGSKPCTEKGAPGEKPSAAGGMTPRQVEIAKLAEMALGSEWVNDAGKWVIRIKGHPEKVWRVMNEVLNARKEKRIKTTPAPYAEFTWVKFR